ncbi:MAG TPA: bifunctional diaminohydroxyphosphoribosylaminopyrimidine deaminase/5-amino-6-(5-phosphoribosylamino)uracil reductase RibD [Methylovirgula sp.]|nr:bifunctional diaminohydroxyphosphoribosylaminopyrimidine deaminase/5-amino-6-(5-phosphoribosylamino)uracil reductase RibD [Methylovirgula sp.]
MSSRVLRSAATAMDEDARIMVAALNLARRGLGRVAPNPAVGALVVNNDMIVGRGFTGPGGRPHAEVLALQQAAGEAKGATLYVTLEPCSHHGRTPPCVDAVIAAGIARVVSTIDDPEPRVAGSGHGRLREAGIEVRTGILAEAALRANLGHVLRVTRGRPMLTLKLAETADGYAAGRRGAPRLMITDAPATGRVHMLRAMHDAVMVGSGTALADDPMLNVRLPRMEDCKPLRVVLDTHLVLPPSARLAVTARDHPTLVIAGEGASMEAAARLLDQGVEVERVAFDNAGHLHLAAVLALLGARGLTRVLCEGGPRLAAALIARDLADEVVLFRSGKALGRAGLPALDSASCAALTDSARYRCAETGRIGPDAYRLYERVL